MGRGGAIYLSYTALVLLCRITPASAGLWDVDIDLDPAPSPEDGPPFSAHATRDRALLPYQIIGVVASYLGTVLIVGILLLTVGKRLRKRAQDMAERPTEMTKPMAGMFETSPIATRKHGWGSMRSKKSIASSLRSRENVGSPAGQSMMSFDEAVLQRHKQRDQDQLANLYGALYEDEDAKMQQTVSTTEIPQTRTGVPTLAIPRPDRADLQRVQTNESYPQSPYSPTAPSYRAVYPPGHPASPVRAEYLHAPLSPVTAQHQQRARAPSFASNRTSEFSTAPNQGRQALRKSIKNLKISAPIQRLRDNDNDDGARTPLSPRFYTDPGTPPEPPSATSAWDTHQGVPVTPGSTITDQFTRAYGADDDEVADVRDMPQANPQRTIGVAQPYPESPEKRRGGNATNLSGDLPLRNKFSHDAQKQQQMPAPLKSPSALGSPNPYHLMSPTKVQYAHAPRNRLGVPLTGGMGTPYSPYFNKNVVTTPVTPRIMSRDERKQRRKEEKATRGVITEEDQVTDEKELWSYAY